MRISIVFLVFTLHIFIPLAASDEAAPSPSDTEIAMLLRGLEEPPLVTENLILDATHHSVTIKYMVYARNALKQEHTLWKIKNEDPQAIGFKITVVDIDIDYKGDSIEVTRDNCLFKDSIHDFNDGPLVHLGETLNMEFHKSFTGLGHGFEIEVSILYEGKESPCPEETDISLDCNSEKIVVIDSLDPRDRYGDYEHLWRIRSDDPNAVGFKITFNNTKLNMLEDMLNISGQECRYEFTYENYNMYDQSQLPPLEVRGSLMTVYIKLHVLQYYTDIYEDLVFGVDLLYESSKSDCSVCEFANIGDYCDGVLCNCTARFSFCDEEEHVCACVEGTAYENDQCQSVYSCDESNNCISYRGSFIQKGSRKTWNESQAICEEEGARLVQISNDLFNEYVSLHDPNYYQGLYFIGSVNGDYENWMDGSSSRGCPVLMTSQKEWNRFPCDAELPFICEKLPT